MNTSGEVADLMVKEGIQITEATVKMAAVGAKELTALLLALLKDTKKLQGKTNLTNLLKSEKPLCILQIKEKDLAKFTAEAKKYGVLFTAVTDKSKKNIYVYNTAVIIAVIMLIVNCFNFALLEIPIMG